MTDYEDRIKECREHDYESCEILLELTRVNRLPDTLKGGFGDEANEFDFDEEQLVKGIGVELEHTDNPYIAKEIALDHLTEHPQYYEYLEKMEKEWKK